MLTNLPKVTTRNAQSSHLKVTKSLNSQHLKWKKSKEFISIKIFFKMLNYFVKAKCQIFRWSHFKVTI